MTTNQQAQKLHQLVVTLGGGGKTDGPENSAGESELRTSGTFSIQLFNEHFPRFLNGELTYKELEEMAGGLPRNRNVLSRLWEFFELGFAVGMVGLMTTRSSHRPNTTA